MRKTLPPNFICIGAPKAGTSWLYSNIKRHHQVKMPPHKELEYFDGLVSWLPLIEKLHKRFSNQYTADWLNHAQRYR